MLWSPLKTQHYLWASNLQSLINANSNISQNYGDRTSWVSLIFQPKGISVVHLVELEIRGLPDSLSLHLDLHLQSTLNRLNGSWRIILTRFLYFFLLFCGSGYTGLLCVIIHLMKPYLLISASFQHSFSALFMFFLHSCHSFIIHSLSVSICTTVYAIITCFSSKNFTSIQIEKYYC